MTHFEFLSVAVSIIFALSVGRQISAPGIQIWTDFLLAWLKNWIEGLLSTRGFHGKELLFSLYSMFVH
jgi:hypothetical protein